MLRLLFLSLLLAPTAFGQAAYRVTLPDDVYGSQADAAFARGVELLHSFEYDDARDAFREARGLEPTSAMAAWGEAMTHNHPVWMQQDRDAGLAVLASYQAAADSALAVSRAERAADGTESRGPAPPPPPWTQGPYIEAIKILFGAPGSDYEAAPKEDRDDAYLEAITTLAERRSGDRDIRAFHALALLGSAHEGRDYDIYGQAADVAQSVLDQDPKHPGALHYLIHAYDDPDHAELALPAARAYSEIVSAASHALHMPTHIYFALGLWDEASALNVRAFEAARDASARRGEPLNNHGWHALYWLNYSELQLGRDSSALALLDTARVRYEMDPSNLALRHLVRIRAQTAITITATSLTPDGPLVDLSAIGRAFGAELPVATADPSTRAADLMVLAMLTSAEGADPLDARARAILDDPDASPAARATAMVFLNASEPDADDATFFEHVIDAVELIESTPVSFGPPLPALLPHELLLMLGLSSDNRALAQCLLDAVEARAPGRRITQLYRDALANAPDSDPAPIRDPVPSFCAEG